MENNLNNEIKEKELNSFLTTLLVIVSIGSIIQSITTAASNAIWLDKGSLYLVFIPIIATIINAFFIIHFIVLKKDIIGVWLFFGMLFIQFVLFTSIGGKTFEYAFIFAFTRAIFFSLILLLRKDGEFAWETLMGNKTSIELIYNKSDSFEKTLMRNKYFVKGKDLNKFLIFLLLLASIGSIIRSITNELSTLMLLDEGKRYLAYIPIFAAIINAFIIGDL